jgi:hypothetical protein
MREKLENQEEILKNQAETLLELERMVIELYSRPCAC